MDDIPCLLLPRFSSGARNSSSCASAPCSCPLLCWHNRGRVGLRVPTTTHKSSSNSRKTETKRQNIIPSGRLYQTYVSFQFSVVLIDFRGKGPAWLPRELSAKVLEIGVSPKIPSFILSHLSLVELPCIPNAPISKHQRTWPLIMFSHGLKGYL